jgi:hypothetical protein
MSTLPNALPHPVRFSALIVEIACNIRSRSQLTIHLFRHSFKVTLVPCHEPLPWDYGTGRFGRADRQVRSRQQNGTRRLRCLYPKAPVHEDVRFFAKSGWSFCRFSIYGLAGHASGYVPRGTHASR